MLIQSYCVNLVTKWACCSSPALNLQKPGAVCPNLLNPAEELTYELDVNRRRQLKEQQQPVSIVTELTARATRNVRFLEMLKPQRKEMGVGMEILL